MYFYRVRTRTCGILRSGGVLLRLGCQARPGAESHTAPGDPTGGLLRRHWGHFEGVWEALFDGAWEGLRAAPCEGDWAGVWLEVFEGAWEGV